MAARLYPNFAAQLDAGTVDWASLNPKAIMLTEGFSYNPALINRDELDDSKVIFTSDALDTPSVAGDAYTAAAPFQWLQKSSPKEVHNIVLFDDTGDDAYSMLIGHWDSDSLTGAPFAPNGSNYYLYGVTPPGGFFAIASAELLGMISTYSLAADFALAEVTGGDTYLIPTLVIGTALNVRDRVCLTPYEVESCCPPTIRSSQCG